VSRRLKGLTLIAAAFVILSAGDCEIGDLGQILDKPGEIVVTNNGDEAAVISITASDVKSYPTLAGGQTASASTNVGGGYQVNVVMTPANAQSYRQDLATMRSRVEALISEELNPSVKTELFLQLAGLKAAILAYEQGQGAGCSGTINLDRENAETVSATVEWREQSGSGFWEITCGSNSGSSE
jgi:hypothetical protein